MTQTEAWDPATGAWSEMPALEEARLEPRLVLLGDGRIAAIGGWYQDGVDDEHCGCGRETSDVRSTEIYDPAREKWTLVRRAPPVPALPRAPAPPRWR